MTLGRATLIFGLLAAPLAYLGIVFGARGTGLMAVQVLLVVAVVVIIAHGADWLVDSACRIAQFLGVSHLVIGLTVVAFGTSAPEIAASLVAGFRGQGDITIANVIGSNVFNLCFILGGVAVLLSQGLRADRHLIRRDGPILLLGTLLLFAFVGAAPFTDGPQAHAAHIKALGIVLFDLELQRAEGVILLLCLIVYVYWLYRSKGGSQEELEAERRMTIETFGIPTWRDVPQFAIGLVAVVGGCHVLVGEAHHFQGAWHGYGALWFARIWNVPDYVVGVTIIAAGTSAPEFVVSLVAAARGAFGISAGNLIGSDIFNMFGVVGIAGVLLQRPLAPPVSLSPAVVPGLMALSLVVLITIGFMRTGMRVSRLEGGLLILIGVARWVLDFAFRGAI